MGRDKVNNNLGRDKLDWPQSVWDRIDQAVHAEAKRTRVAAKVLPLHGPLPAGARTVPGDSIIPDDRGPLRVDEGLEIPLTEIAVEFALTEQQVEAEAEGRLATAVTLATRATNLLVQAEDRRILRGAEALREFARESPVHVRTDIREGVGLAQVEERQTIRVAAVAAGRYGERIFEATLDAYAGLQERGHYGPYALVLAAMVFADAHRPIETSLVMPADRIKPLVTQGFHGTGALAPLRGVFISLGGNTMDLAVAVDTSVAFLQVDNEGMYRFRAFERFALRLKDSSAIRLLIFEGTAESDRLAEPDHVAEPGRVAEPVSVSSSQ